LEYVIQHNSPIYDESETQSAKVFAIPHDQACLDDSNDTPKPMSECQLSCRLDKLVFRTGLNPFLTD